MKSFYKVFLLTVLTLFVCVLAFRSYSGTHFFTDLWDYHYKQETGFVPLLIIWLLPAAITMMSCLVGRIFCLDMRLVRWERKALTTDFFLIAGSLLVAGFLLFMEGDRKLWDYPEHIVLVFGASVVLGLLIILIKDSFPLSFRFLPGFYCSTLVLSALFIFSGIVLNIFSIKAHYLEGLSFNYIAYFIGMAVLLSIAGMIYGWLLQKQRILAYVMGCITLLLFLGVEMMAIQYPLGVTYDRYFSMDGFRIPDKPEPATPVITEWVEENETDEESDYYYPAYEEEESVDEEEWDYRPDIHFFTFEFLWDDPSADKDSIRASLHFVTRHIKLQHGIWSGLDFIFGAKTYKWYEGKTGREAYLSIMKYLYDYRQRIDLPSIFEGYAKYLPAYLPYAVYQKNGLETTVKQLLLTYEDIMGETDGLEYLDDIYELMEETKKLYGTLLTYEEESVEHYYQAIALHTRAAEYTSYFMEGEKVDYARIIWAYSFWGRRYDEGNHKDVLYILRRLEQIYK